jgi:hypothetical protein
MIYYLYKSDEFVNFEQLSSLIMTREVNRSDSVDLLDDKNDFCLVESGVSVDFAINAFYGY